MASRTPMGGSSAAVQYQDFKAKSEWKEEEGANVLFIHLPDFLKEQIKITYLQSSRTVRVVGERPLAHNKWSRFNQAFSVPRDCEVSKIQGKFQDGVLSIIMPTATITQPRPKEEAKATKGTTPPAPPKDAPTSIGTSKVSQIAPTEPKEQKGVKDTPVSVASRKQTDAKKVEALSPEKRLKDQKFEKDQGDEVPSKATLATDTLKQKDEKGELPSAKTAEQKPTIETKESTGDAIKKPTEPVKEKTLSEQEDSIKKGKVSKATVSDENSKRRKESMVTDHESASSLKPKVQDFNIAEKVKEMKNVATTAAKKTAKGLNYIELSEERQAMVNMGVAVLVIVALGAYIAYSYRFSSSGPSKQ